MLETVLIAAGGYFALGLVFALVFHVFGLARTDPGVTHAGVLFRLLVTPGLVGLWPLMAWKWRQALAGQEPGGDPQRPLTPRGLRDVHRRLAWTLLIAVPLAAGAGLALRPRWPADAVPSPATAALLPVVLASFDAPFGELPITAALRGDERGQRQLEVAVTADPELPGLMLFLTPDAAGKELHQASFLGPLGEVGRRIFPLPPAGDPPGTYHVALYSAGHRQTVAVLALAR